nr:GNAT family N-acetyltransferase [uncultured Microbacterium sp.]
MRDAIDVVTHADLTSADVAALRRFFDAEYLREFGDWDPDLPYGYAPHDVHVVARHADDIVGHVGWARRTIGVGQDELVIAGLGGVLIAQSARGDRLGSRLMRRAAEAMEAAGGVAFGYLGCREEVAAFFEACGWSRIAAGESSISRAGRPVHEPPGPPLLVLPVERGLETWPDGEVDLRGRAW